ncbi:MAG: 23S rRNA (guanosine(2251)-2'-O)-methyltransferase RlmB [Wenzhouxiangella sp.]|nr:23S rRNA (guanosine(2251)-2'-O)-methyltransferase RlmB [Wenzhouxiangella sp.]TVR98682.1 MAG: 23S rRNA (guanosine(2251)-2'-O)-methyltransferase RlmB [Wenzhouxiangellaceae bacterium]
MKRELAMGINSVEGLIRHAPERVVRVWLRRGNARLVALAEQLAALGVPVEYADDRALDRLSGEVRHQGVVAEFRPRQPLDEHGLKALLEAAEEAPLLLVLDGVQDPHNLGACLRTAAAAGALAVIVPRDRAAGLTPTARRAAAGAAERVPLVQVTNLARCLAELAEQGIWCLGLAGEADSSLYQARLDGPLALVLGSEERGLRRLTRERCDQLVSIPMASGIDSLNVSVAAGVSLFEVRRLKRCS